MYASFFDGAVFREKVLILSMDIHFFSFKIAKMSRDSLVLRPQRKKYNSPFDYRRHTSM